MALPAFAQIDDLDARRPGGVKSTDHARAQAALQDASSLIRVETNSTWMSDDDAPVLLATTPDMFLSVACSAARRALDNPDGIQSESLDGYAISLANASSDVYLTAAERRLVRKAAGVPQVFPQATTRDPEGFGLETPGVLIWGPNGAVLIDTEPAGDPIVWGGPDLL